MSKAKEDYKNLLMAILSQTMDDYIKLQHPRYRKKKYLQEAFDSAVKMFFDESFELLYFKNDEGDHMSLNDLLSWFISDSNMDLNKLKEHVVSEAKIFWENKLLNVLDIPESFIYDGHVYQTHHTDESDYTIDFEAKTITLNKNSEDSLNQENFIAAAIEVLLFHEEIPIKKAYREKLNKAFFRMIRMNSCFLES